MFKGKRRWISQLKQKEWICPLSILLFYSDPQILNDAHLNCWRWCLLCSILIQMLISSGDRHPHRHMFSQIVFPAIWASLSPNWYIKLSITLVSAYIKKEKKNYFKSINQHFTQRTGGERQTKSNASRKKKTIIVVEINKIENI